MNWIKHLFVRWLLADVEARILDLEKHFVTKRNAEGAPIETLADVPLQDRAERRRRTQGMSWAQRRAYLEATEGGTRVPPSPEVRHG